MDVRLGVDFVYIPWEWHNNQKYQYLYSGILAQTFGFGDLPVGDAKSAMVTTSKRNARQLSAIAEGKKIHISISEDLNRKANGT